MTALHNDVGTKATALVLREDRGPVTTLTLNRPRQLNALSAAMLEALGEEIERLRTDEAARIVVLAGAGSAFCAGHDLKEMRGLSGRPAVRDLFARCSAIMLALTRLPQPIIARVHGIATAAGCQLVAAADLAIAADTARFATSGINVGLFCSTPSVPLIRAVPPKAAFEMLVTGDFIDAERAKEIGLINAVAAEADLDVAVGLLADRIIRHSPLAIGMGKQLFYRQRGLGLEEAYGVATDAMADNMMADDAAEGIDAFVAKRTPRWRGR